MALVVLQVASQMIQMMKESGPGLIDLMNLQAEMLKKIQEQIGLINQKVNIIYGKLDELKAILNDVPDSVAIKLCEVRIAGKSGRYAELSATYQRELNLSRSIERAREAVVKEMESDVISPLREARDDLISSYRYRPSVLPSICIAAFIESHAMIMADVKASRQIEALKVYRKWLSETLEGDDARSIKNRISELRKAQASNTKAAVTDRQDECNIPVQILPNNYCPRAGMAIVFQCTTQRIQTKPLPIRDEAVADAVREMISRNILPIEDRPTFVRSIVEYTSPLRLDSYCQSTGEPTRDARGNLPAAICTTASRQKTCAGIQAEVTDAASKLSAALSGDGLSLMAYHAWRQSAEESIAFIDRLLKQLEGQP